MSLKMGGDVALQTAPNSVLYGATSLSISLKIRVDAFTPNVDFSSNQIGQTYSGILFAISNSQITVVYNFHDTTSHGNYVSFPILVGTVYHVVFLAENNSQKIYINNELMYNDTQPGSYGTVGWTHPYPFQIVNVPGISETLDQLYIWNNYTLSDADIKGIFNCSVDPSTISPSNIAWGLSTDGTIGVAVQLGDAGITDKSSNKLDITSITGANLAGNPPNPATYDSPLVFIPPSIATNVSITDSCMGLLQYITDRNGNAVNLTSLATKPTITINGEAITTPDPIYHPKGQNWVYYPLPNKVSQTDKIEMTTVEGWAKSTVGPVDQMSNVTVPMKKILPPFVRDRKRMRIGTNIPPTPTPWTAIPVWNNYAWLINCGWQNIYDFVQGYPKDTGGKYVGALVTSPTADGIGGIGFYNSKNGIWTLYWRGIMYDAKGNSGCVLAVSGVGDTCVEVAGSRTTVNGVNSVQYQINADGIHAYSPTIYVYTLIDGPTDLGIYSPGTGPGQIFHPEFLRMLKGMKVLRSVTAIDFGGGGMIVDFDDFMPVDNLGYGFPVRYIGGDIESIEPYDDSVTKYFGGQYVPVKINFKNPHGVKTSNYLTISTKSFPLTSGLSQVSVNSNRQMVITLDDMSVITTFNNGRDDYKTRDTLTQKWESDGTWTAKGTIYPGIPLEYMVELCNQVGADLHLCIPCGVSDACVASIMEYVAKNLKKGLKFRVEYTNEAWNYGYAGYAYCSWMGNNLGIGATEYYVKRASQVHAAAVSAFSAVGRQSDVVRIMGTCAGDSGITGRIVQYASDNGISFDELSPAFYLDNCPFASNTGVNLGPIYDGLVNDQLVDMWKIHLLNGGWEFTIRPHYQILKLKFSKASFSTYEGSIQSGVCYGSNNPVYRSRCTARHPDMADIVLFACQMLQDEGVSTYIDFEIGGSSENNSGVNWNKCNSCEQVFGPGDGTNGSFVNSTANANGLAFAREDKIESVISYAFNMWTNLMDNVPPDYQVVPLSTSSPYTYRVDLSPWMKLVKNTLIFPVCTTRNATIEPSVVLLTPSISSTTFTVTPDGSGEVVVTCANTGNVSQLVNPSPIHIKVESKS